MNNVCVWEVDDEVEPIALFYYQTLGVTSTFAYYCYAMLVDVDWVRDIHDRCEISFKSMVYLRWQLKYTSGWIEVPGYSRIACFLLDRNPGPKGS